MMLMRKAGVREARQDLTSLLDDVRKGREVVITERGQPVARLVPIRPRQPFPDLRKVRLKARAKSLRLSQAVLDDREDRG
jgi:prevent-host-death family protein